MERSKSHVYEQAQTKGPIFTFTFRDPCTHLQTFLKRHGFFLLTFVDRIYTQKLMFCFVFQNCGSGYTRARGSK